MTLLSGFFNSVDGDRRYSAEDFARVFDGILEDGVFRGIGQEFEVTADGGLNLLAGTGRAWFNDTWSVNTAPEPFLADPGDAAQPRIDVVVLEVDTSVAVRRNSLRLIKGTPSANPQLPTMTHTSTLNQYPVASIDRPANSSVITNAQITKLVGTMATPYASTNLMDSSFDPAQMHRNVFRGKNLGNTVTDTQRANILNGSFDDIYVGDFWAINGVNWRVVDLDYYLNKGPLEEGQDLRLKRHHALLMPDTVLRRGRMNESASKNNQGGYRFADCRTNHFPSLISQIEAAFGPRATHLLQWYQRIVNAIASGKPSSSVWMGVQMELPSTVMMTGANWFTPQGVGENVPPRIDSESSTQLALFRLAPQFIQSTNPTVDGSWFWLRDVSSQTVFNAIGAGGDVTFRPSQTNLGFRPIFGI